MILLLLEALVRHRAVLPEPLHFSEFPKYYKDYGQAYPAIHWQATMSAMGQTKTALTPDRQQFSAFV
jgi:hypothetical protein